MCNLDNLIDYVCWYLKEGSAFKLVFKILCTALLLTGAILLLYACIIRNILRWVFSQRKIDTGK